MKNIILIEKVNGILTDKDKEFLISFEHGTPEWNKCCAGNLSAYPSVQWKLLNIAKLQSTSQEKHKSGIEKLALFVMSENANLRN